MIQKRLILKSSNAKARSRIFTAQHSLTIVQIGQARFVIAWIERAGYHKFNQIQLIDSFLLAINTFRFEKRRLCFVENIEVEQTFLDIFFQLFHFFQLEDVQHVFVGPFSFHFFASKLTRISYILPNIISMYDTSIIAEQTACPLQLSSKLNKNFFKKNLNIILNSSFISFFCNFKNGQFFSSSYF